MIEFTRVQFFKKYTYIIILFTMGLLAGGFDVLTTRHLQKGCMIFHFCVGTNGPEIHCQLWLSLVYWTRKKWIYTPKLALGFLIICSCPFKGSSPPQNHSFSRSISFILSFWIFVGCWSVHIMICLLVSIKVFLFPFQQKNSCLDRLVLYFTRKRPMVHILTNMR